MIKEWLTDSEKRILFSALAREMNICEELDKKMPFDPLVPIVESLEKKFYYDRLFKEIERVAYVKGINDASVDIYNQVIDDIIKEINNLLNDTLNDDESGYSYGVHDALAYCIKIVKRLRKG